MVQFPHQMLLPLKLVDQFTQLDSNIKSIKNNVNIYIDKAWTGIDWLSTIWKFGRSNKIEQEFFLIVAMSVLFYGSTTIKCK